MSKEINDKDFLLVNKNIRFLKIKEVLNVYVELISEKIIKDIIELDDDNFQFFKFLRNLLMHFPLFDNWDDFYIKKSIILWCDTEGTIHKFLMQDKNLKFKIRTLNNKKNSEIIKVNLKLGYIDNKEIYLKDVVSEKNAVSLIMDITGSMMRFLLWIQGEILNEEIEKTQNEMALLEKEVLKNNEILYKACLNCKKNCKYRTKKED